MSVYLGNQKVTVPFSLEDPDYKIAERDTPDTWTRPADMPNLDAIEMDQDFEGVYLTYDNDAELPYHLACFYCTISGGTQYKIETGHLNSNNQFVTDKTETVNHNAYVISDYSTMNSTTYPYIVFRLTPLSSSQHFTRANFGRIPVADSETIVAVEAYKNFCVERRGQLKWVNTVANSSTNHYYCTRYMLKDATVIGVNNIFTSTNFTSAWSEGRNLREIDFTGWDTSRWTITSLEYVFYNCHKLCKLDLNKWDTSNWGIINLTNTFGVCENLITIATEKWDTSKWKVTTLSGTWDYCRKLEELNLENWDTSDWAITSLANTWRECIALKKLNISSWDTSNWKVTAMNGTWSNCRQLLSTNLSRWNTAGWAVTTLANTWYNNIDRRNLYDIENWDTSNWKVTSLSSTWSGCFAIKKMNLNNWNTSGWAITTLASAWASCQSLIELNIGQWNVSNWKVTTIASAWYSCYALKEVEAFQWHTPAWEITTFDSVFRYCYSLKEIDFTNWDASDYALTSIAGISSACEKLEKLDMSNIDISTITTANNYGTTSSSGANTILYNSYCLKEFNPPTGWKGRIYFSTAHSLPRSEMVKFFNNLVDNTGDAAIGIVIGVMRSQLTAADIKIATDKNYTIT